MNTKQKGFSVVELLAIAVVVGIVAAVGWFVFSRQKNTNSSSTEQNSQQQTAQQAPAIPAKTENAPEGWKTYDTNANFSFIYPKEWEAVVKVTEYPVSEVFKIRYVGEIKLNQNLDDWVYATEDNGATIGAKATVIRDDSGSSLPIWRFGFGDAGYGSFIPTFVASGKIFQITTESFCPEEIADCLSSDEYLALYDTLVASIKLK